MVKVTRGIIDKCGVRGDATLCVVIFNNRPGAIDVSVCENELICLCFFPVENILLRINIQIDISLGKGTIFYHLKYMPESCIKDIHIPLEPRKSRNLRNYVKMLQLTLKRTKMASLNT